MTVVRMWETRLAPAREAAFWSTVREHWPRLAALDGFVAGEAFRSDGGDPRAVLVTRWVDASSADAAASWERVLDAQAERPGHGWGFRPVEVWPSSSNGSDGPER